MRREQVEAALAAFALFVGVVTVAGAVGWGVAEALNWAFPSGR